MPLLRVLACRVGASRAVRSHVASLCVCFRGVVAGSRLPPLPPPHPTPLIVIAPYRHRPLSSSPYFLLPPPSDAWPPASYFAFNTLTTAFEKLSQTLRDLKGVPLKIASVRASDAGTAAAGSPILARCV